MVIMADGKIFTLRSHRIADGSLDFYGERQEVCEQIKRAIFYVLSPRRMQRMEVVGLPLNQSKLPRPYGTGVICILKTGGVGSEGAVSKGSPRAIPCLLRLYL